jgi:hypothetical protein
MEMVELYVKEVGRHLPEKMRPDIEREIRSTIEDTLEDESQKQDRPVDEAMVIEELKRLGAPRKVAASYLPARYLIGPELFSAYVLVLRVVLTVLAAVGAIFLGISLGLSAGQAISVWQAALNSVGNAISWYLNTAIWTAGVVTLIFAILQWSQPHVKIPTPTWDPRSLKAEPDPEWVNRAVMIAEIVLTSIAIVLFNFYPQWIGIVSMVDGRWVAVPVLTPDVLALIPWYTLLMALNILLRIDLSIRGCWSAASHWEDIALKVFTIVLSIRLFLLPAMVSIPEDIAAQLGWSTLAPGTMAQFTNTANIILKILVGLGIFGQAIEVCKRLYQLLVKRQMVEVTKMG